MVVSKHMMVRELQQGQSSTTKSQQEIEHSQQKGDSKHHILYIVECTAIEEAIINLPKNENIRIITDSKSFTKAFKATKMKKWNLKKLSKGTDILKRIKKTIREREKTYESQSHSHTYSLTQKERGIEHTRGE